MSLKVATELRWATALIPVLSSAIFIKLLRARSPLALAAPLGLLSHPITWAGVLIFVGLDHAQNYVLPVAAALATSILWLLFTMAKAASWVEQPAPNSRPIHAMSTRYAITSTFAFIGGLVLLGTRLATSIDTRFLGAVAVVFSLIVIAFFFFERFSQMHRKQRS